jgi:hypothetical protein
MKKLLVFTLIAVLLGLAACSSTSTETPVSSTSTDLPIETQLALGTLKLAGTEQDVSAKQAEELVVYWQVYLELSQSETSAQAEMDGLVTQIRETMTDEQMQAITDMEITAEDVLTSIQGMAAVSSNAGDSTVSVPSSSSGIPAGGPPADGGAPPDGGAMPSDMGASAPASGVEQSQAADTGAGLAGITGVPSALIDALVQSLQERIAA